FARASVRLQIIGALSRFDGEAKRLIAGAVQRTAGNTRTTLAVALGYGGQDEIVRAANAAAAAGEITAQSLESALDTADLPPLDLLIRTSGEVRLSNFLLWQCAYAELYFTDVLWPDFTPAHLADALQAFATRERRFGGL
ncbi:MAG: polyprenyl diphosphate synthase, partial [Sphingopyxis sp.]